MSGKRGYTTAPFSLGRRMVAATSAVNREFNTIHAVTEVDISGPRANLREHKQRSGESLSLTAYVVATFARALQQHPELNSFRRGRRLVILDDITVNTLVEREIDGERVPESYCVRAVQSKSFREVNDELRTVKARTGGGFGELSGSGWLRFIPAFLFKSFIRFASRSLVMAKKYGKVGVTAVGMHGGEFPLWFLPLSGATVLVTVGSIVKRARLVEGKIEEREHLCLTVSFDHDIVDGAPAARFIRTFEELLRTGAVLREESPGQQKRAETENPGQH